MKTLTLCMIALSLLTLTLTATDAFAAAGGEFLCTPAGFRPPREGVTLTVSRTEASILGASDREPMTGRIRLDVDGRTVHKMGPNGEDWIIFDVAFDGSQQLLVETALFAPARNGKGRRGGIVNFIAGNYPAGWACAELK